MVGVVYQEINLSSLPGIIHRHLIVLVWHKQAQMCLQAIQNAMNDFLQKILKYFIFSKFSTTLLTYSLIDAFSQA